MAANIITLTDENFDEVVKSSTTPVLVDYWAAWCGPCKAIAPILEELSSDWAGRITIAKLDVDAAPETARRFEVMSIPTLILFKDGEAEHRMVGARGKAQLVQELTPHLPTESA
ncbi:MAG TPA: thioredoxin [Acidimicrobiales bacterium]|nr:thioredoxin [Acidimicrobiales bacterium]